jgi:flavorubredoxin
MTQIDTSRSVEIADGVHWIGFNDPEAGFRCNPYLLIDHGQAILFDPGSVPHFPQVLQKFAKLIDFNQVSHVIVTHQDPDLCGCIPQLESLIYGVGGEMKIVSHPRASVLISHYGVRSEFYHVDEHDWKLTLNSGRELQFIFAPYLHFPGAYMTYDPTTKILFSGDIFGAFSFDWSLYCNDFYKEAMKAFHENYMPSKKILRFTMDKLDAYDIEMIAPQHGSIINRDVRDYIDTLKNLDCGDFVFTGE